MEQTRNYWVIYAGDNSIIQVDTPVMMKVREAMVSRLALIEFKDIFGCEITLVPKTVEFIAESTHEQRVAYEVFRKLRDKETAEAVPKDWGVDA